MKPSCLLPSVCAAFILSSSAAVFSQTTATTDPVGFITLNIAGTGGTSSSQLSFAGLGLTRPVEYQGAAETVTSGQTSSTLFDQEATWADNQFNGASGAYYLEITGPTGASGIGTTYDITATNATAKTITVNGPLGSGIANGATFKIRKHWTIASVFGANNESGLQGGANQNVSDQIRIYNPGTSTYDTYFYSTGVFGTGWRKVGAGTADQGPTIIYPDDGVLLTRVGSASVNVVLMGAVKTGQTSFPIFGGTNGALNIVANPYAAPMTLGSSNLYTGNSSTGVTAGANSNTADQIRIYNSATSTYDTYYYSNGVFGTGWRKVGGGTTDQSSVQIPVGASFLITRQGSTSFNWVPPQHPAAL